MNNQKLILTIGFILLGIIGYQGYLLYQNDHTENKEVIEKKIVKKDAPEININIDQTAPAKVNKSTQNMTNQQSSNNVTDEERRKLDEKRIEQSIQDVFKSIFASKDVQDGLKQFKQEAQRGLQQMQAELQALPQQLDNLSKEMKNDPMLGQIIAQLQGVAGKKLEDKGDHYYFKIAVPGGKDAKVDIKTRDNFLTLTMRAKSAKTTTTQSGTITQNSHTESQELIMIPADALIEKLQTHYQNGFLEITIPKIKAAARS